MYYWVIVLFSLVTIMTYKLSSTSETFDRKVAPLMETSASEIVQQHNAALKYIRSAGFYDYTEANQVLDANLYQANLPYGHVNNNNYKTVVYCLNINDGNYAIDCDSPDAMNFLATYGSLPAKWTDEDTIAYFLTILGRYTGYTEEVGVVENISAGTTGSVRGSTWVIDSVKGKINYVPQMFECVDTANSEAAGMVMYLTQLTYAGDASKSINSFSGACNLNPL